MRVSLREDGQVTPGDYADWEAVNPYSTPIPPELAKPPSPEKMRPQVAYRLYATGLLSATRGPDRAYGQRRPLRAWEYATEGAGVGVLPAADLLAVADKRVSVVRMLA